jgi:secreted trypsin-like serine protease
LIQYKKPNNVIKAHCGGSLITNRYVLTAAHCDRKVPKSWKLSQVRLGEYNQETNPDCFDYVNERVCADPYIEVAITNIVVHNEYNPDLTNQPNDIALLRMARDVTFTDWVKPICLPEATLRTIDFAGHELEVAGFGKTEFENSNSIKLKVGVNAYTQDACKRAFPTLPLTNKQVRFFLFCLIVL